MKLTKRAKEILKGEIATEHDLLELITNRVLVNKESQGEVAKACGVSAAFLHDVLHGNRTIGEKIPAALGWKRVIVFVKEGE